MTRRTDQRVALIVALIAAAILAFAAPAGAKVKLKKVGTFSSPTYVTSAPGTPGILVVEQGGRVISVKGKKRRKFLDITRFVKSGGEQGLLSLAFKSNYRQSGLFYAYYTSGNGAITVAEFRRGGKFKADPSYQRIVLTVPHPTFTNHNGGQLQFGPDGLLYIGTGDGGGAGDTDNSAQTTDNLLGKMLRIDPRPEGGAQYSTPGNAFAKGGGRPEILSIGLRNPFRFSFDRSNLIIGDVGQNRFEEIDYVTADQANGANFGWNDFEGFSPFSGAIAPTATGVTQPIYAYSHDSGGCSVIAGYVGHRKRPKALRNRLVFGDFCSGKLSTLKRTKAGTAKVRGLRAKVPQLSSFGLGGNGSIYAASQAGRVFKLTGK